MKRALAILLCGAAVAIAQLAARRAPSWALTDGTGKVHDLLDYRGKPLLIDMMQTMCPHCGAFADIMEQVHQKYGDRLAIVAIVTPPADNADTARKFAAAHKVTYPILFDVGQMQYSYILQPKVDLPHLYLIDAAGYIRGDWGYGLTTHDIFEGKGLFVEIDKLLAAKK